jgi:hypothetical protein
MITPQKTGAPRPRIRNISPPVNPCSDAINNPAAMLA